MKIAIAADHGGFDQKAPLKEYLESLGHEVVDFGPETGERVDYPDYAIPVARAVAAGEFDYGVLICGTGIGMSLAANKVHGIRSIAVQSEDFARLCRAHNNVNVLCLSGRFETVEHNKHLLDVFLSTEFEGGRHAERIDSFMALEDED